MSRETPYLPPAVVAPAETAPKDPEQLFADHAGLVRGEGDPVDALWDLRVKTAGWLALTPAALSILPNATTEGAWIMAGVGTAISATYLIRSPFNRSNVTERINHPAVKATGQNYELYRDRRGKQSKRPIVMRYSGPASGEASFAELVNGLDSMVALAEANDIRGIAVDSGLAGVFKFAPAARPQTNRAWLKKVKKLDVKGDFAECHVQEGTTALWRAHTEKLKSELTAVPRGLLGKLAEINPSHPLARKYANRPLGSAEDLQALIIDCKKALEQRGLGEVERGKANFEVDVPVDPENEKARAGVAALQRPKLHTSHKIHNSERMSVMRNGARDTDQNTMSGLGLREDTIAALIESPAASRDERAKAVGYLLLAYLDSGKRPPIKLKGVGGELENAEQYRTAVPNIQLQVAGKRSERNNESSHVLHKRGRRAKQAVAALMVGLVVGVGGNWGQDRLDDKYKQVADEAHRKVEADKVPEDLQAERVQEIIEGHSVYIHAWDKVTDWRDIAKASLRGESLGGDNVSFEDSSSRRVASSQNNSKIGNAERTLRNETEWQLESHDMTTAGLWAVTSSNKLTAYPAHGVGFMHEDANFSWTTRDLYFSMKEPYLSTEVLDKNGPWISASRTLGSQDIVRGFTKEWSYSSMESVDMIPLPVLVGTRPVAASYDGQPVRLHLQQDGSFAISLPEGEHKGKNLTYWLAPDPNQTGPWLRAPLERAGDIAYKVDPEALEDYWRQLIPDLSEDPAVRVEQIGKYTQKFKYTLTPFDNGEMSEVRGDVDFTRAVVEDGEVVCNVQATLNAMASPEEEGVVFGYRNSDDKSLTIRDTHLWNNLRDGQQRDWTPGSANPDLARYFDAPPEKQVQPVPLAPYLWGLGIAVGARLAIRRRRQILRVYNTAEKLALSTVQLVSDADARGRERRLLNEDPGRLRFALDISGQAAGWSPAVDLLQLQNRAAKVPEQWDNAQAVEALKQPYNSGREARARVAENVLPLARDKAARRQIKKADGVMRRAERLARTMKRAENLRLRRKDQRRK